MRTTHMHVLVYKLVADSTTAAGPAPRQDVIQTRPACLLAAEPR